jgi:hypothetical protein
MANRAWRWELVVELAAVVVLLVPTSLILFFAELVWRDGWIAGEAE